MKIKAIIPAAGFGTRMLPFAKAVPKELLPLVNKPVIQYVVEEAVASGIEEILIILSSGKEAIINHFSENDILLERLTGNRKLSELSSLKKLNDSANIQYLYQQSPRGLGDAVRIAENFAGDSPIAVLLGDTVMKSSTPNGVTGQLIDKFYSNGGNSVVALEKIPLRKTSRYGIVDGVEIAPGDWELNKLIEKPSPEDAPSNLAVAARYLFTPGIFAELSKQKPGVNGEIQLTDAINQLLKKESVFGCQFQGKRFDLGEPAGFIAANVEFGLQDPECKKMLKPVVQEILEQI